MLPSFVVHFHGLAFHQRGDPNDRSRTIAVIGSRVDAFVAVSRVLWWKLGMTMYPVGITQSLRSQGDREEKEEFDCK